MNKKIIIAGGGTGGHIFPAIAIANALKEANPSCEILFIGAKGKMEMEKVPQAGYTIEGIDIAGFNRSSLIKNISLPYKLMRSFFQVRNHFISFMPDAVIGVGGYSSYPVLRYAQAKGIPTFIHEANSFAGKSNILLGRKATEIYVASEGMEKFFPSEKMIVTGNPVRDSIINSTAGREEAMEFFALDSGKTTVLSIGGSLGAQTINEAIDSRLDIFGADDVQLIWQTGKQYINKAKLAAGTYENVKPFDFINRMDYAYAAADLVISRAGAMAIAELSVVRKPVVFVPFPYAAENHQEVNARHLVDREAAVMIMDADAKDKLVATVMELVRDEEKCKKLKQHIGQLAITDAASRVASRILQYLDKQKKSSS